MKKLKILLSIGMMLLPMFLAAASIDDGTKEVAGAAKLFGTIIVVVAVSLWMLPIAFAGLVYTGQKKKAEQMHEDVGLKAAILALLAGIMGAAMAYYVVGTIGAYSMDPMPSDEATRLKQGNQYIMSAVIGKAAGDI